MGRQIEVAMDLDDEAAFLAFLRESAEVAIYRSWSPLPHAVPDFSPEAAASPFYLHNLAIKWLPRFEVVNYQDRVTGEPGQYHRLVEREAPVIEYSRHPLGASDPQVAGRLYWSKNFISRPEELSYDIPAFDAWFTAITRWVRSHAQKVRHGSAEPWCLPAARRRLQNEL